MDLFGLRAFLVVGAAAAIGLEQRCRWAIGVAPSKEFVGGILVADNVTTALAVALGVVAKALDGSLSGCSCYDRK
jgi:hypothetical protein